MGEWSYPREVEPSDKLGDGACLPGNGICNVFKANIWRSVANPFILLISATYIKEFPLEKQKCLDCHTNHNKLRK